MKKRKISILKKPCAFFLILILVGLGFIFYQKGNSPSLEQKPAGEEPQNITIVDKACKKNSDCDWMSTNCCDENSGAFWDCVNLKNFSLECPSLVLCPQVISPKPTTNCLCEKGDCIIG